MKALRILAILSLISGLLAACAPTATPTPEEIVKTVEVIKTVEVPVEKTVEVQVTVEVPAVPPDAKLTFWMFASYVEGMDDYFLGQVKEWSELTKVPVDVTFISNEDAPAKFN